MGDYRDSYWYTDIREIKTFGELLTGSAEAYPDNAAFWVKQKRGAEYRPVTYKLLKQDVEALGLQLRAMNIIPGRVAVMGTGSYEWVVTYLAVTIGGGVIVPLDKELSTPEIQNLLDTAECTTIFYTSDQSSKIKDLTGLENRIVMYFYGDRTDPQLSMDDYLSQQAVNESAEESTGTWKQLIAAGESLRREGILFEGATDQEADRMSVLLFTSGTTGNPKGVMLSQRNVTANIMDTCRIAHILPEDKTLSLLPIHHTYECTFGILLFLYRGASTAFCEGLKYIVSNMNEAQNTVIIAVPLVLEMIYKRIWKEAEKQGRAALLKRMISYSNKLKAIGIDVRRKLFASVLKGLGGKLRIIITGAAAIEPGVFRGFEDMGITVLQGYGLTECTPLVSGTPQSAKERYKKAGSVGLVVKTGQVKIIDKDEDGIGEILFKGPNVMLGYYNMPEATADNMSDGWFKTGDLGFMDKDGWLYLTGRHKNVIVTKTGKNIYPEEIEEVLNRIPVVSECMVYGLSRGDEDVVAVQVLPDMEEVESRLGHKPDEDELYKLIKSEINEANMTMTSYKRVKDVIIRKEDFVRTTTKKIKRAANMQQ